MALFSSPITTMATLIYALAFTVPVSMERDTLLPEYASYEQVFRVASISLYLDEPFYDLEHLFKDHSLRDIFHHCHTQCVMMSHSYV